MSDVARDGSVYGEGYYRTYEGGSYDRGGHWTMFFGYIADEVVARWGVGSMLDAGCALGVFVEEMRARGVDAWGVDLSEYAVSQVPEGLRPYCFSGSLVDELPEGMPRRYDVVTCIEVLEHMPVADADRAAARLCSYTDRILFSSTPDGYAEATHHSCRPPEQWSAVFARHGFFRDPASDASFVAPWAVVYTRQDLTVHQAVLRYDGEHARLRQENRELRARVVELDARLSRQPDPEAEVLRLREEVARLRDEVVGAAAEAETARAMQAEVARQAAERATAAARTGTTSTAGPPVAAPGATLGERVARAARGVTGRMP
jgi:hypothetical protein